MAWLNLPTDMTKIENALLRIADALERVYPPSLPRSRHIRGPEAIVDISGEAVDAREKLDSFLDLQGLNEEEKVEEKRKIENLPSAVKKTLLDSIQKEL